MMAHIGLALALAAILHAFKLYNMPQGGSRLRNYHANVAY